MSMVSVSVFSNVAFVQLLQISMVDCLFIKHFPMAVITLSIPHHKRPINQPIEDILHSVDETVSTDFISESPNKNGCTHCECDPMNLKMRIVGGDLAEQNEFPWMVALSRKGKFYCGATLITQRHLLTAAHCVEGISAKEIKATLGEFNRAHKNSTQKIVVRVKKIIRHPEFQISDFKNDIAILKLDGQIPSDLPHIQSACLPNSEHRNYTGIKAVVAGWGRTDESKAPSNELRKVQVPILSLEDCRQNSGYVSSRITDNMMCAGYHEGQKDSCQGDSGGPLQINGSHPGTMEVIGIVSWGRGCARPNFPGVYTRIESYMSWVNSNIEDECYCKG
ncbi:hypothetical protein V9T40_007674 [Parthenolecanium corni]|uniref:Peptidase S1 domain-containing protein n=1 Tax=Parthenolecanium corni TaxID=536013 RepID=A0AAN9TJR0_9HEMI